MPKLCKDKLSLCYRKALHFTKENQAALADFFYPRLCLCCERALTKDEESFCLPCFMNLPRTNHFYNRNNELEKIFYGRLPLELGAALYWFRKSGMVQNMIHNIKYKKIQKGAYTVGQIFADSYIDAALPIPDLLIPVPLHKNRLRKRGFNQSTWFVKGIAKGLCTSYHNNVLVRIKDTETQTKKNLRERWDNVSTAFSIINKDVVKGKRVMLADDVITTGATLESCGQELIRGGAELLIIGVIAMATSL